MTSQSPDLQQLECVRVAIAQRKHLPGPLLEILHAIQAQLGHVPPAVVPAIAEGLNLSRAEVHGVLTFYHYFRDHPPGRRVVRLCRAEACQAMGANALAQHVKRRLGAEFHATSANGEFTLEPVYCFGNCARAPAVMIDDALHGCMTAERFDELLGADGRKP